MAALIAGLLIGLGPTAAGWAAESSAPGATRCEGARVVVRARGRVETELICAGASDAIAFLADQGLNVATDVVIEVVAVLPEKASSSAVGCFVPTEQRVYVLRYADFSRRETWFGVPIERSLYRSLAAHEVAHAIGACNFKVAKPSSPAWEYVAYVAMLSTMEPSVRDRVLSQYPGLAFETEEQMNATLYQFDPTRFAVGAYGHFLRAGNGRQFLHAVLAGKALVE